VNRAQRLAEPKERPPGKTEDEDEFEDDYDWGPTPRDRSNIAVARFLDIPRRIAQERVPTASNVGSRDVTWASQPTPLIPFRVFSRVSRAPFLTQSGDSLNTPGWDLGRESF
jgi:hypothetical protein